MKEKQGSRTKRSIHFQISTLLFPYLNGSLSAEEDRLLFEHLPGCVPCQRKLGLAMQIAARGIRWDSRNDAGETALPDRMNLKAPLRK